MQESFLRAAMMITDYSSVMFEMALLGRPVLYYQFDFESFFAGAHTYEPGYFSYERDGYGPVVYNLDGLLAELESMAARDFDPAPLYRKRMDDTFQYHDTRSSERVLQAILSLDEPDIPNEDLAAAELTFARRALREGDTADAGIVWQRIRKLRPMLAEEAELALAEIATRNRDYTVAAEHFQAFTSEPEVASRIIAAQARLAVARGEWDAALALVKKLRALEGAAAEDEAIALEASISRLSGRRVRALASTDLSALGSAARLERARALIAADRADEAVSLLEPALDSLNAVSVTELARAFRLTGRVADAARLLNQLGSTNNSPERDAERAAIACARGDWNAAVKLYTRAAQWPEPTREVLVNLAKARRKAGDSEGASRALRKRDTDDERPKVLHQRALALAANREWSEAADAWERLIGKNPAIRPIVYLHWAEALLNISEFARADEAIKRFDDLSDDDQFGDRLRARLMRQFAIQ